MKLRSPSMLAIFLVVAALAAPACEERTQSYEDAGERLDRAIKRVEELKRELAEAEQELQRARAAIENKVEAAPSGAAGVPAPLPPPPEDDGD